MKIALPASGYYTLQSKVTVFTANPFSNGEKLISGNLSAQQDFEQTINIPAHLQKLFLVLHTSTGEQIMQEVTINGNQLIYRFPSTSASIISTKSVSSITSDSGPGCDVCDVVISGSGLVNIGNGLTYCTTGSLSGTLNFQSWNCGGTHKVCGTATVSNNISLGTNCHIIVTGNLTTESISMWGNNNSLKVYAIATLNVNGGLTTTGVILNNGNFTVSQQ